MTSTRGLLWEYCPLCGKQITLTQSGTFRVHGKPNARCPVSGYRPETLTDAAKEKS